jgi:hypothetical protein
LTVESDNLKREETKHDPTRIAAGRRSLRGLLAGCGRMIKE